MTKALVLRIAGIAFIIFQVLGYYGSMGVDHAQVRGSENRFAYFLGFNFFLFIGIALLIISFFVKKKSPPGKDNDEARKKDPE